VTVIVSFPRLPWPFRLAVLAMDVTAQCAAVRKRSGMSQTDDGLRHGRLSRAPDRLLAERAGEGDVPAFAVLVRRHEPLVRVVVRRVLGSTSDVDDVVQEALVKAWNELPQLKDPDVFRAWLVKIATRKAFDSIRSRKVADDIDLHPEIGIPLSKRPEVIVETRQGVDAVTAAVNSLPDNQRQAWFLREIAAASYAEIARELCVSQATVRGLLERS